MTPISRSAGTTSSKTSVIDQLRIRTAVFEYLGGLGGEPVDRRAEVLRDHQPLGVAAPQQLGGGRVALVDRQEHLEAVAVEPDVDALVDQALDVVEVVGVAAVGDLHAREVDALLLEDLHLPRPGGDGGHRVRHDRRSRLHARARDGAVDLLDVLGDARGVGGALQERRADVRPLDAAFDVLDEVVRHHVHVAVLEVVGEVVVAVDPRAGDDPHARLLGDTAHEVHVAPAEHRRRVDDRLHAAVLGGAHRLERRVELELVVVAAGPLVDDGLVAEADVLVHEHDPERLRVDCSLHGLYLGHRSSSVGQRRGAPQSVSSRSCFFRSLPLGLRGSGSWLTATYWGTLKSARFARQ